MKTQKGVPRRTSIQIKDVALPVSMEPAKPPALTATKPSTSGRILKRLVQTTDILRIAAKPHSCQLTAQSTQVPRIATKPPSNQHTLPVNTSQQAVTTSKTTPIVQISVTSS